MRFLFAAFLVTLGWASAGALPQTSDEDALTIAATPLADSRTPRSRILGAEPGARVDPDVSPQAEEPAAKEADRFVYEFDEEVWPDYSKQARRHEYDVVGASADETEGTNVEFEDGIVTCRGDGLNSTEEGYCKEESRCQAFAGESIGLCWRNADVTAVCCKPKPGHHFPTSVLIDALEVDFERVRRATGSQSTAGKKPVAVNRLPPAALKAVEKSLAYMTKCDKSAYVSNARKGTPEYSLQLRQLATRNENEVNKKILEALTAAKYLMKENKKLNPKEALDAISKTPLGEKLLENYCEPEPICDPESRFRTFDGSCNNLQNPLWGKAGSIMLRLEPEGYGDGLWEMAHASGGSYPMVGARRVTSKLFSGEEIFQRPWSTLFMEWGQFLDHDISLSPSIMGYNDTPIACCKPDGSGYMPSPLHPACIPINIPYDDPFYKPFGVRCMNMVRTNLNLHSDCVLTPAQQRNAVSAYVDGSQVYGSSKEVSDSLRSFKNGELRTLQIGEIEYLPSAISGCTQNCPSVAGDKRVNQLPGLTIMHNLWLRKHNQIARIFSKLNPQWNDERIFQETRKCIVAFLQRITLQYLSILFGRNRVNDKLFGLNINATQGYTFEYNKYVQMGMIQEFGAGASRFFGHSSVMGEDWMDLNQLLYNSTEAEAKARKEESFLHFFNCGDNCYDWKASIRFIYGMILHPTYKADSQYEPTCLTHLFPEKGKDFGFDLTAIDIQRGRDHGLKPYYVYVQFCKRSITVKTWDDLLTLISKEKLEVLKYLYKDVKNVDLFAGLSVEEIPPGAFMGPTSECLSAIYFYRMIVGDRFWFTEGGQKGSFTEKQLKEIQDKVSLSMVMCESMYGLNETVREALLIPNEGFNKIVNCSDIANKINFDLWKEEMPTKLSAGVCKYYENGAEKLGTCMIAENCAKGSYASTGDCKPAGLKCCTGKPGIMNAHINYNEPSRAARVAWMKSERSALEESIKAVRGEYNKNSLANSLKKFADGFNKYPDRITYLLMGFRYANPAQTATALDVIASQLTTKKIVEEYLQSQPGFEKVKSSDFYGLPWHDVRGTNVCLPKKICDFAVPVVTRDGSCNNPDNPEAGVAGTALLPPTYIANRYRDDVSLYPLGSLNNQLPNPRLVAAQVFSRTSQKSAVYTLILPWILGMLHMDISETTFFPGISHLDCCDPQGKVARKSPPGCVPIHLGRYREYDPFFASYGIECLPVLKPIPGASPGCMVQGNGPMSRASGSLDLNPVYGSSAEDERRLRKYRGGLMKLKIVLGDRYGVLEDDRDLRERFGSLCDKHRPCKSVGSDIVNQYPPTLVFANVLMREHNRVAKALRRVNTHWTDDELYHEARIIAGLEWRVAVYNDLVPLLFGPKLVRQYRLRLSDVSYNVRYTSEQDSSGPVDLAGAKVLGVVLENMIAPVLAQTTPYYKNGDPRVVETPIFTLGMDATVDSSTVDLAISEMISQYAEALDPHFHEKSETIIKLKDKYTDALMGRDVVAEIIQRSRIDGLGSYNEYRKACGFKDAQTFDDLKDLITDPALVNKLSKVYKSPKDVDLLVAVPLESPYSRETPLGGVTLCILANFFKNLMTKDHRFFNHPRNPRKNSPAQLRSLSKVRLSSILCDNTEHVDAYTPGRFAAFAENVLLTANNKTNPVKSCYDLHHVDLSLWKSAGSTYSGSGYPDDTGPYLGEKGKTRYPSEYLAEEYEQLEKQKPSTQAPTTPPTPPPPPSTAAPLRARPRKLSFTENMVVVGAAT